MTKTKIEIAEAVAKMRTAIDNFGEGLEESGIQWKSYGMDDKVRAVYDLCHGTVVELQAAVDQAEATELRQVLIKIIVEGIMTNDDGTLIETFKPPCQVCATTKRLASEALCVVPFWEDGAKELNQRIREIMGA